MDVRIACCVDSHIVTLTLLSHLTAAAGKCEGHLCSNGALANATLARKDQDDVLDAGQLLRNGYKICFDAWVWMGNVWSRRGIPGSGPLGAVAHICWFGHPSHAAALPAASLAVPGQSVMDG